MIGKEELRRVVCDLEKRMDSSACRGALILEVQRTLFGSVRISLEPSELTQVFAILDESPVQRSRRVAKRRPGAVVPLAKALSSGRETSVAACVPNRADAGVAVSIER